MTLFLLLVTLPLCLGLLYLTKTPGKTALVGVLLGTLGAMLWTTVPVASACLLLVGLCGVGMGTVGGALGATWRDA